MLRFSIPAGLIAGIATATAYELARRHTGISLAEARTLSTLTLLGIGLVVLAVASRPLQRWKVGLVGTMAAGYGVVIAVPWARRYFELDLFTGTAWAVAAGAVVGAGTGIALLARLVDGPQRHCADPPDGASGNGPRPQRPASGLSAN